MSPYITDSQKKWLQKGNVPLNAGELNWEVTTLLDQYLMANGVTYETLNTASGVLFCAAMELYRRITGPYEDQKLEENGEAYFCVDFEGPEDGE